MQIEAWEVQPNLMMARYYSSSLGRFMEVDPGGTIEPYRPQSWNKYAYAFNNPINHTDPDGRHPKVGAVLARYGHPLQPPSAQQVEAAAKTTSSAAGRVAKASFAAGLIAAGTLQLPEAGAAFVGAGTAGLIKAGADVVAALANDSKDNKAAVETDTKSALVSKGAEIALTKVGVPASVAEPLVEALSGVNDVCKEEADRKAASTSSNDSGPLVITTREADATPIITTKEEAKP